MNDGELSLKILIGTIVALFIAAFVYVMVKPRATWTTDLPHATCAAHVGTKDYRCVRDGIVYLCIDDYRSHHVACAKLPAVQP